MAYEPAQDAENVEVDARLDLIQAAANKLTGDTGPDDLRKISDYIEALCRHRNSPVSTVTVNTPDILRR